MTTKRTKRYFGMTIIQLAILGCLAFVACGTVAGGLLFASSSTIGGGIALFPSPAPSATPLPTSTPFLTATPAPTSTATLIPYEELIPPGWNQHTTTILELWVPPQFNSINIDVERQATIDLYRDLGYEDYAEDLENNPSAYVFWFKHSDPGSNLFTPNINIGPALMTAADLDTYLNQAYADGPQEFVVVNRQEFAVGNYEARRWLLEANLNNIYIGVAQYAIFDGTDVWFITGGSHFNEFYSWLPEFDKVARTFRLIDQ